MAAAVVIVDVELSLWNQQFQHRLHALHVRVGKAALTLAVREQVAAPRGRVLLHFDPLAVGQLVLVYHPDDFEQVYELIGREPCIGRMVRVEAINPRAVVHV